jgi:hypothetical protein
MLCPCRALVVVPPGTAAADSAAAKKVDEAILSLEERLAARFAQVPEQDLTLPQVGAFRPPAPALPSSEYSEYP